MDIKIKQARIYMDQAWVLKDIYVKEGKISSITAPDSGPEVTEVIDAQGNTVIPGCIDVHTHINEPGRTGWEGFATGSRALAAGGVTTFFDMPLNSSPPAATAERVQQKQQLAAEKSVVKAHFWGALLEEHLEDIPSMKEAGVIGFKAFMSPSGIEEFPHASDRLLLKGMERIAALGSILAVHAESEALLSYYEKKAEQPEVPSLKDFANTRPVAVEAEAVQRVLLFAEVTGCKLHICHVSSKRAVELIKAAKRKGVDVTAETCPHYLFFTAEEADNIGATAKCAPPIRGKEEQEALWQALLDGDLDLVSSDHSPAPEALKQGNVLESWGGIAGAQQTLDVLLTKGYHERGIPLEQLVRWVTVQPASRFSLGADTGTITPGADADLVIIDLNREWTLQSNDLKQRHKISPYTGQTFHGKVIRTIAQGKTVYES